MACIETHVVNITFSIIGIKLFSGAVALLSDVIDIYDEK